MCAAYDYVSRTDQPFFVMGAYTFDQCLIKHHGISHFYQFDFQKPGIPSTGGNKLIPVPAGTIDLIFAFDRNGCRGFLCGPIEQKQEIDIGPYESIFGLRMMRGAIPGFLTCSAADSVGQEYPLEEISVRGTSLEPQMMEAKSFQQRVRVLQNFYDRRRDSMQHCSDLVSQIRMLESESGGTLSMADLTESTGFSRSYLDRMVKQELGYNIRTLRKIIRLQAAIQDMASRTDRTMTRKAVEHGYYDQSHFIHDFESMMNMRPGEFSRLVKGKSYQGKVKSWQEGDSEVSQTSGNSRMVR